MTFPLQEVAAGHDFMWYWYCGRPPTSSRHGIDVRHRLAKGLVAGSAILVPALILRQSGIRYNSLRWRRHQIGRAARWAPFPEVGKRLVYDLTTGPTLAAGPTQLKRPIATRVRRDGTASSAGPFLFRRRSSGVNVGWICEAKVDATTCTSMGGTSATQSHLRVAGLPFGSSGKSRVIFC